LRASLIGLPLNFGLAILTGVLLILVYPSANFTFLAAFAITPLLIAVSREPRPLMRFVLGWTAGVVYWFGICRWIQFVLEVHGGMGRWGGWGSFFLFCAIKAIHLGLFSMFAAIVMPHPYAIPAVAALWTGIERTHSNAGFAWLALGNAGIDMQLPLRFAPFIGVYGLSFLFASMAAAVALVILRRPRKQLAWMAMFLVAFALPAIPAPEAASETALVVQPNLNEEQEWSPVTAELMHEHLIDLSLRGAQESQPRLIVWPEAPGPFYYYRDPRFHEQANTLARQTHAYFLLGTVAHTPKDQPLNSAVLLSPDGQLVDRYDKIHLVPFGEYVPPIFEWVNRITQEAGDFAPGSRRVLFPMAGHRIATFICYESAFPNEVRKFAADGAEMLVNISNDGYFGKYAARAQHLELVRMRAVENRRWIVRATNDGISAVVDPGGRVVQQLPPYSEQVAKMGYSYVEGTTVYTRTGDWFAWGCLAVGIVALFASQWPHYTAPKKVARVARS
jgi:apolipoprotein N-acyltransferase